MKEDLTEYEARMRKALHHELKKMSRTHIVPDRADIITKHWVVGRETRKQQVLILEGRLERNVWSGDIKISFRRYHVRTNP